MNSSHPPIATTTYLREKIRTPIGNRWLYVRSEDVEILRGLVSIEANDVISIERSGALRAIALIQAEIRNRYSTLDSNDAECKALRQMMDWLIGLEGAVTVAGFSTATERKKA